MELNNIVVEIHLYESGKLRAFCDVTISTNYGEVTIKGFRIVASDNDGYWIAYPTSSYKNSEGETVRKQIVETTKILKKRISDKIMEEYSKVSENEK